MIGFSAYKKGNSEDLAYLSFWAYNTTVLLHLLKSEPDLAAACEDLGVLLMLVELVNAIHGESLSDD